MAGVRLKHRRKGLLGESNCGRQTALPVGVRTATAERHNDVATAAARGAPVSLVRPEGRTGCRTVPVSLEGLGFPPRAAGLATGEGHHGYDYSLPRRQWRRIGRVTMR